MKNIYLITTAKDNEQLIKKEITEDEFKIYTIKNREEYEDIIKNYNIDLIILDYNNQFFQDLESFYIFRSKNFYTPFIIIGESISEEK